MLNKNLYQDYMDGYYPTGMEGYYGQAYPYSNTTFYYSAASKYSLAF
jgi:hypothetical protein